MNILRLDNDFEVVMSTATITTNPCSEIPLEEKKEPKYKMGNSFDSVEPISMSKHKFE